MNTSNQFSPYIQSNLQLQAKLSQSVSMLLEPNSVINNSVYSNRTQPKVRNNSAHSGTTQSKWQYGAPDEKLKPKAQYKKRISRTDS